MPATAERKPKSNPSKASTSVEQNNSESANVVMKPVEQQKENTYVPLVDENYLPWGNFEKVVRIIESNNFYPIWITGLSGNGKTVMVEQACAKTGREFIRVNFTLETDENDLIGGFRLVNGDTHFHEGPVVEALRRGAILLLDEIDVGHTNKIMCLQSVLENKGVLIKATGEFVKPKKGFNIFATSNTKGRGTEDGRFIGTNIMNGAFLDRFAGMMEQDYPPQDVEEYLLKRYFITYHWEGKKSEDEITDDEFHDSAKFVTKICEWANQIRDNFSKGIATEVITTRSLINIIQGYAVFGDKKLAISLACSRFDEPVRDAFLDYYDKLDDSDFVPEDQVKDGITMDDDGDFMKFNKKP